MDTTLLERKSSDRIQRFRRVTDLDPDEYLKMRDELATEFVKDSPLKSEMGKEVLAETLATLTMHLRTLYELQAKGKLAAEESRTIPSIASNIKRISEDLKISAKEKSDDSPFDL